LTDGGPVGRFFFIPFITYLLEAEEPENAGESKFDPNRLSGFFKLDDVL
jgi:hypothetical protein